MEKEITVRDLIHRFLDMPAYDLFKWVRMLFFWSLVIMITDWLAPFDRLVKLFSTH